jgi:opacity protein-like surface antigen
MRRAAGLVFALGLMGATAAHAADVAGWYAGIYAGTSSRSDTNLNASIVTAGFNHLSTFEHPTDIRNNDVIPSDPALLRIANLMLGEFKYAQGGSVGGTFLDGTMNFDPAFTLDFVIGYSLGNGGRIEAHYTGAEFDPAIAALDHAQYLSNIGSIDPSTGVWTWAALFLPESRPGLEGPAAQVLGFSAYSTRADFFLVDGWYDFDTGTAVSPYLGGGVGLARISSAVSYDCQCGRTIVDLGTSSEIVPAAELGGGLRVKLADPVTLDLAYRFRMAASSDVGVDYFDREAFLPGMISVHQSGPIGIHALSTGLTFALN